MRVGCGGFRALIPGPTLSLGGTGPSGNICGSRSQPFQLVLRVLGVVCAVCVWLGVRGNGVHLCPNPIQSPKSPLLLPLKIVIVKP